MSDDQPADPSPVDDQPTPPAGDPSQAETISLDEARKLRREAQKLRGQVRDLEAAVQAAASEKESDLERLMRERDEALAARDAEASKRRAEVGRFTVTEAARRIGALEPAAVWRLVETEALTLDDDGRITNLDEVLAATKTAYPALFRGPGSADGGAGTTGGAVSPPDINALLRQSVGRD